MSSAAIFVWCFKGEIAKKKQTIILVRKISNTFFQSYITLRIQKLEGKSVDPDEAAHIELPYLNLHCLQIQLQSTLVISKSKGPSKTLRDIRTSTYQICSASIEEKTIRTTKFHT